MIYVLYHANCYDGFGAAWAAWRKLGGEDVTYEAVNYGDPWPCDADNLYDDVYILDFSWPRDVLLDWKKEQAGLNGLGRLVVLDHHKTAKADLEGLPFATFDLEKSGAVLAWEHFHPGQPVPLMLQYIQDRDLWQFKLPSSREVSAWMRSHRWDFHVWSALSNIYFGERDGVLGVNPVVLAGGDAILRFQARQVEIMADNAVEITLGGHKVHAANATCFFSEVGEEICKRHPDEPFAGYWLDRADGKRQWGLRSRGGFDCTTVAKQYGGGGHPGSAGFTTGTFWRGEPV